jgi:sodium/proline symporter
LSIPILITFVVYFAVVLAIGVYFCKRSVNIADYLLGGRGMGAWVTALSAQASDMSGWLLMGLPGAVYLGGLSQVWIAVGLFAGTCLNWKAVSVRLRIMTERTDSITLPCFFEARFKDPTGLLRTVSAIIILIFFTIYASSGLVATGKLFESTFGIAYHWAVIVGGGIIIAYTFLGGFQAVCWTDLFQGMLMVAAIVIVPAVALTNMKGTGAISHQAHVREVSLSLMPRGGSWPAVAIVSAMAWGLGYFGQPHILARFMSAQSRHKLNESMVIAIVWVLISLAGAVGIGLVGIGMFDELSGGEEEKVFIYMVRDLFNPWAAGILLAAILSAIMSTIDSQLLVSSSALTEDFYQKVIKKEAPEKEVIWVGRICVILISIVALLLSLRPNDTILGIVAYAWGGFGAAFGPLVLFSLYSKKTTWYSALAGMVVGTVILVLWKQTGLGETLYEIVPGFAANVVTMVVINLFRPQRDEDVLAVFKDIHTSS